MEDDDPCDPFIMPPLPTNWRIRVLAFFRRHAGVIRTSEYAISFACAIAGWFGGGDMFLTIPVLLLGWVFASIGISLIACWRFKFSGGIDVYTEQPFIDDEMAAIQKLFQSHGASAQF
jgi:hypothetical protein